VFVCIPPGKAVPEMTCTVSGGTLNLTHSLTLGSSINDVTLRGGKGIYIIVTTCDVREGGLNEDSEIKGDK